MTLVKVFGPTFLPFPSPHPQIWGDPAKALDLILRCRSLYLCANMSCHQTLTLPPSTLMLFEVVLYVLAP
jgi:hypothetical protein